MFTKNQIKFINLYRYQFKRLILPYLVRGNQVDPVPGILTVGFHKNPKYSPRIYSFFPFALIMLTLAENMWLFMALFQTFVLWPLSVDMCTITFLYITNYIQSTHIIWYYFTYMYDQYICIHIYIFICEWQIINTYTCNHFDFW